ncbi:hypothetical protein ACFU98_13620 [Streptomyces sp. NPDC057575]|uniref:hypothetical protein n=1 Tax=unclassified Streptomyces TaxID=2593676 RepID=UPI0036C12ADF
MLADLQCDRGFGCLFITHYLAAVEYLADRIAVMYLGQMPNGPRPPNCSPPRRPAGLLAPRR